MLKVCLNIISVVFIFIALACNNEAKLSVNKYREMLKSNDPDSIITAAYYLGELKDTTSIDILMNNLNDPRVTNKLRFKGISVYQAKTIALEKITGQNFGNISYQPDSIIIKKWEEWYRNKAKDQ